MVFCCWVNVNSTAKKVKNKKLKFFCNIKLDMGEEKFVKLEQVERMPKELVKKTSQITKTQQKLL